MIPGSPSAGALTTFWLGRREYAFPLEDVLEVTPLGPLTPVPGTSQRVAGVTAWRGRTLPVLEPSAFLKTLDRKPDVKRRLLVLRRPGMFGWIIERPGRIVLASEGEAPEGRGEGVRMVRTAGGVVRVLDPVWLAGDRAALLAREWLR